MLILFFKTIFPEAIAAMLQVITQRMELSSADMPLCPGLSLNVRYVSGALSTCFAASVA